MAEDGLALPPEIQDAPELAPHLAPIWEGFVVLGADRQLGMGGAGPIPWSSIDRWAQRQGIDGEDFDEAVLLIRALDAVWLEDQAARMKEGAEKPS